MSSPSENDIALKVLATQVQKLEADLKKINPPEAKWKWSPKAMDVVDKLRALARENMHVIREDLDKYLAWPNKQSADPKGFYSGKPGAETFIRTEDWFEKDMKFKKYETPYTFSNGWDKREIMATFLVPKDLKSGDTAPIMWFIHGGGFCTGAGDHIPWYSKASLEHAKRNKAIVIAPDYPLGPEANYKDITDSLRDFLKFYKEDGFFKTGGETENRWSDWLQKKPELKDVKIDRNRVFVEGESAGGHAAVTTMFLNADKGENFGIPIKSVLLRFPMIKHYERSFPEKDKAGKQEGLDYCGTKVSEDFATAQVGKITAETNRLEGLGLLPTRVKGYAPQYMAGAFLLSTTKLWQGVFQRRHAGQATKADDVDYMDGLERAKWYADKAEPAHLPPIFMYHGADDTNCPIENTLEFKNLLLKHYPKVYIEEETVHLKKVTELKSKFEFNKATKILEWKPTDKVPHAFDYDISEETETWLKDLYEEVDGFWNGAN